MKIFEWAKPLAGVLGVAGLIIAGTQFAVADVAPDDTATISASLNGSETGQVTGKAYQVIVASWSESGAPEAPQYVWGSDEVATWVRTNYPEYVGTGDNSVQDVFNDGLDASTARDFYHGLAAAVRTSDTELGLTPVEATATNGEVSFADVAMGGWLVTFAGGVEVYEPSVVLVYPTQDETTGEWSLAETATIVVKSSTMPITKTTSTPQVGINDVVTFTIEVVAPTYPEDAENTMFGVYDRLPDGLELAENPNVTITADGVVLPAGFYELVTEDAVNSDGEAVDLQVKFDYSRLSPGAAVVISYQTVVTAEATPGVEMVNDAAVVYANDPYTVGDYSETPADETVYTYGLYIAKTDQGGAALPGVTFTLSKDGTALQFVAVEGEAAGTYRAAVVGEAGASDQVVTGADGNLLLAGLGVGEFSLKEVVAPDGFALLKDAIAITIVDADVDGVVDENPYQANDAIVALTVQNFPLVELPKTGTTGTVAFTASGLLVGSLGVALALDLARRKRKSAKTA